ESLQIQRALGDAWMTAHSLNALGEIARLRGDLAGAREHYAQALEATRGSSDSRVAGILLNLGLVAFAQRDWPGAREFFERSLDLSQRLGEPGSVAACLDGLAGVHAECGDPRRAARLLGAADALRASIGEPVQSTDFDDHERFVAAARGRLDDATFAAERAAGARLSGGDAIESARGGTVGD
ncbi:MAG TPA: tetratricopeptide repeat protein, partial [Burkholderiaceae bacterium]|nr:tetratricopeptide repeat protein [Burkholderiaceae bacterium]